MNEKGLVMMQWKNIELTLCGEADMVAADLRPCRRGLYDRRTCDLEYQCRLGAG